jgi:hypothetical protein
VGKESGKLFGITALGLRHHHLSPRGGFGISSKPASGSVWVSTNNKVWNVKWALINITKSKYLLLIQFIFLLPNLSLLCAGLQTAYLARPKVSLTTSQA